MSDKTDITERLKKLVIQRKTQIVETKRTVGHRPSRSRDNNLAAESYSYSYEE